MTTFLVYTFRDPALLARTVARLRPHPVVVHVDAKADRSPFVAAIGTEDRHRVRFLDDRVVVNWGGWSQVVAIRRMVAFALESAADDEYLVLLSGSDYPIRPIAQLDSLFSEAGGAQFLRHFAVAGTEPKYTEQFAFRRHRDLPALRGLIHRPWLRRLRNGIIMAMEAMSARLHRLRAEPGLVQAHGPTHFAITAALARRLEAAVTPQTEALLRQVFVPEEKFYQSIAATLNATGADTGAPTEPYQGPGNWRYANLHHIHPSLTKVYTEADWDEVRSSHAYFLRKLDSAASATLLDRIDRELLGTAP